MATSEQVKAFIDKLGPIAAKVCRERGYGNTQVWTCICQAALETGWGQSSLMTEANAFFGIKATGWKGKVYNSATREVYDGQSVTINADFRAYDSLEDSVKDYFDLLEWYRYSDSLKANTVQDCITIIRAGGYATDPGYVSSIVNIYNSYKAWIEAHTVDKSSPSAKPKYDNPGEITYQVMDKRWWPAVKTTTKSGTESYAGDLKTAICCIRAKGQHGKITLQAHIKGGGWLPRVSKYDETTDGYAGVPGKSIDALKIWCEYGHCQMRVKTKDGWLAWIDSRNCNGNDSESYAGVFGKDILAVQIR